MRLPLANARSSGVQRRPSQLTRPPPPTHPANPHPTHPPNSHQPPPATTTPHPYSPSLKHPHNHPPTHHTTLRTLSAARRMPLSAAIDSGAGTAARSARYRTPLLASSSAAYCRRSCGQARQCRAGRTKGARIAEQRCSRHEAATTVGHKSQPSTPTGKADEVLVYVSYCGACVAAPRAPAQHPPPPPPPAAPDGAGVTPPRVPLAALPDAPRGSALSRPSVGRARWPRARGSPAAVGSPASLTPTAYRGECRLRVRAVPERLAACAMAQAASGGLQAPLLPPVWRCC